MLKETTNKEKFKMLDSWMPNIVESIKRDLKNEHLKKDYGFFRHYFSGKNLNKLSSSELAEAYSHAIENNEKAEELAEFIINRWLLKHTDLYEYFEKELSRVNPDFSQIETLESSTALPLMEAAIDQFGAPQTYLFCVLNSVVFPNDVYQLLKERAHQASLESTNEAEAKKEEMTLASLQRNYEQQMARLTDKYEKKLTGLQKKYIQDIDVLKKQVAALQRKLSLTQNTD